MKISIDQILAIFAALVLLGNAYEKYENIFGKKKKKLTHDVKELQYCCKEYATDITNQKQESKILCKGILACLRGLEEQGCNGPVHEGIAEMEQHLLDSSH